MSRFRAIKLILRVVYAAIPGAGVLLRDAFIERLPDMWIYWPLWVPSAAVIVSGCAVAGLKLDAWLSWQPLARHFRVLKRTEKLDPEQDLDIQNYQGSYVDRGAEAVITKQLQSGGVALVIGKPSGGKTRLSLRVLNALNGWYVLYPAYETLRYEVVDLSVLRRKRVVLFLNDLDKYVDKFDPVHFRRKIRDHGALCAVLANCRDGPQLDLVRTKLNHFYEMSGLVQVRLDDLSEEQGEELARRVGREWYETAFDGTPGSVLLDLKGMAARYTDLPSDQSAAMKALKLLHAAAIHEFDRGLTEAVAERVWGLPVGRYQWEELWKQLESKSFVRLDGSRRIRVYDPYLERCVTKYQAPEEDFTKLFELLRERRDEASILYLAGAYWDRERGEGACQCIEAVLDMNPVNADAHGSYAYVLLKMGRDLEAERHYKQALVLQPDNAWFHRDYAELLARMERNEEAEQHWVEALRLGSGDQISDAHLHEDYADFLKTLGREDEAQEHYLATAYLLPADHLLRPGYLVKGGRPDEAEAYYQEKLRAKPDDAGWHAAYGSFLHYVGKDEEAKARYQEALRLRPGDAMLYVGYAWLLVEMGDAQEAETHCLTALRLNPNDNGVHQIYAAVLRKLGRTAEADYHAGEAERLRKEKEPEGKTGP